MSPRASFRSAGTVLFPCALTLLVLATPTRGRAQGTTTEPAAAPADPAGDRAAEPTRSRFSATITFLDAQPLGGLRTGPGVGFGVTMAWALDARQRLRLRAEARFTGYGSDERDSCLSEPTLGCVWEVNIRTDYSSDYFGLGPELRLPLGAAELVLDATVGTGSFLVTTWVDAESVPTAAPTILDTDFSDSFMAGSAGAELRLPLSRIVAATLGVHYQHNGQATYVPEGGLVRSDGGAVSIATITSDANQAVFSIGLAFRPFAGWIGGGKQTPM